MPSTCCFFKLPPQWSDLDDYSGQQSLSEWLLQLCLTLFNPMDCSPPGSSVQGILHARILEWVAMPSPGKSSRPRDWTQVSYISSIGRQVLYRSPVSPALRGRCFITEPPWKPRNSFFPLVITQKWEKWGVGWGGGGFPVLLKHSRKRNNGKLWALQGYIEGNMKNAVFSILHSPFHENKLQI